MRTRDRVLAATVVALAFHAAVVLAVFALRPRTVLVGKPSTRVEIAFAQPSTAQRAELSPRGHTRTPVNESGAHGREPSAPIGAGAPPSTSNTTPEAGTPSTSSAPPEAGTPPSTPSAPPEVGTRQSTSSAPPEAGAPSPIVRRDTRGRIERTIQGTQQGPQPSLDALDPTHELRDDDGDAAKAKRFIDKLARVDSLPKNGKPPPLDLVPNDRGGYLYSTGGFTAEIHEDGTVTFKDKHGDASIIGDGKPRDPMPTPHQLGDIRRDSATMVNGSLNSELDQMSPSANLVSGSFDPTAEIMRAMGKDPYAAEHICFLDETADLRADMRLKFELKQLGGLRKDLERVWFDGRPASERRAQLFALWDDCRDDGEVGDRAREIVLSFIRQQLPKGSVDAFTDVEIASFNAHRSSAIAFKPYG
jgi:hypothetical protein